MKNGLETARFGNTKDNRDHFSLSGSSEAEAAASPRGHRRRQQQPPAEETTSLDSSSFSMSLAGSRTTCVSPLYSDVVQEQSNRRHSLTQSPGQVAAAVDDMALSFGGAAQQQQRQSAVRRSARSGAVSGPLDPKIRFAQFRPPLLALKPLFFQVPSQEDPADGDDPAAFFWGRTWIFRQLANHLMPCGGSGSDVTSQGRRGVIITGATGSGKTSTALQLVEYSCFGRSRIPIRQSSASASGSTPSSGGGGIYESPYSAGNSSGGGGSAADLIQSLGSRLVSYHFCQADNSATCLVPDFVHSLAAQLCQAPQLVAYRSLLLADPELQAVVSMKRCIADPHGAFVNGILEPLAGLKRCPPAADDVCLVVVDALCEAEYHRPDYGDTIGSFLARHALQFPHWLKVVVTVRSSPAHKITQLLPYATLSSVFFSSFLSVPQTF